MRRSAAFRPQKREHAQKWFKHTVSAAAFCGVNAALRGSARAPLYPLLRLLRLLVAVPVFR